MLLITTNEMPILIGHKFIEQIMTNHYEPEFSSMDRPEVDVTLEVRFMNNRMETKRFPMVGD